MESYSIDHKALVSMTKKTGVFKKSEIDMCDELLGEYRSNKKSGYVLLAENIGDKITGFAIFGKTPCTLQAWDLYWFVVDKEYQGKGVASKMLKAVEAKIKILDEDPVIRVETSSRDDYSRARAFYEKSGFTKTGIIPNFYAKKDDLVIYHKQGKKKGSELGSV